MCVGKKRKGTINKLQKWNQRQEGGGEVKRAAVIKEDINKNNPGAETEIARLESSLPGGSTVLPAPPTGLLLQPHLFGAMGPHPGQPRAQCKGLGTAASS